MSITVEKENHLVEHEMLRIGFSWLGAGRGAGTGHKFDTINH